jgi:hypothetical protein
MAGTLAQILATKADLENGKLKTNQIPEGIGITLDDVKADNDIASTLSLKHSNSTIMLLVVITRTYRGL